MLRDGGIPLFDVMVDSAQDVNGDARPLYYNETPREPKANGMLNANAKQLFEELHFLLQRRGLYALNAPYYVASSNMTSTEASEEVYADEFSFSLNMDLEIPHNTI